MKRIHAVPGALLLSMGLLAGCETLEHVLGGGHGHEPGGGKAPDECRSPNSNGVCKVEINVPSGCTSGACVMPDPDPVVVGDGTNRVHGVHILWKLPQGFAFCSGDGITFKGNTADQFSDNYASGGSAGSGSPNYHWKDANTARSPKGGFPYTIRFHDKSCTTLYEKDPGVVNEM